MRSDTRPATTVPVTVPGSVPVNARRSAVVLMTATAALVATALIATALAAAAAADEPPSPPAYAVVPGESYVLALTEKAGLLAAFGHRHAILGTEVDGVVCFDARAPQGTVARVRVPTASLLIDGQRGRELAGFEGGGPKASDVEKIQADMLSADYLAADEHPQIGFRLATVERRGDGRWRARGPFSLRGVERPVTVPVELERRDDGTLVLSGAFTVRQTDHGFQPASVAGVVKVADPVEIRFHLVARPTGEGCPPAP